MIDVLEPAGLADEARTLARLRSEGHPAVTDPEAHTNGRRPATRYPDALERLREVALVGAAIEAMPPPEPLVADWLDIDSLASLYGRPSSGKSFLAIDLALHVATGSWWHGHEVAAGHVVYVIAEGARGTGQRVRAWRKHNRYHGELDVTWLPLAVNLLDIGWADALVAFCAQRDPALVVVDTLNRSMPGGNENGPEDMGRFIMAIDNVRRATGACVLVVHHSGKDEAAGSRGHSSLLGALDTELRARKSEDGVITLDTTKQKDHPDDGQPRRFVLAPAGDSAAIAPHTGRRDPDEGITAAGLTVLDALRSIALPGGVATTTWREQASGNDVGRSTFYEQVKKLHDLGEVRNLGTHKSPRWIPADQEQPQ